MSKQLYEGLLKTLKGAKKERKQQLAEKAGFSTIEDYRNYLEEMINPEKFITKVDFEEEDNKKDSEIELTDIVIAFDNTGSMNIYIDQVKSHVKNLISSMFKENPNLNMSIVAFGDYCDMISKNKFGKAYQVIGLTNNQNDLVNFVNNAKNTSGGDADEFYELVIKKIVEETEWREGSSKSVLLIADCDPHPLGYSCRDFVTNNQIDWKEEAKKAREKGIKFDTLSILNRQWYQELSDITEGVCLPFKSSDKTGELLEAVTLARGGINTVSSFMSRSVSKEVTSDVEMNSVYSMYKEIKK